MIFYDAKKRRKTYFWAMILGAGIAFFIATAAGLSVPFISVAKETSVLFVDMLIALALFRIVFMLTLRYGITQEAQAGVWTGGVSVLVPAYNEEKNIEATLRSLVASTRMPDEIIVIDDGSTDGTLARVFASMARHPGRIRLIRLANGGKANALNVGLAEARHEAVVAIDGDTIVDRCAIERLVNRLTDPKVGAVAGKICAIGDEGLIDAFQKMEYAIGQNLDKAALAKINAVSVVPGAIGAWRKSAVLAAGGYSATTLVEDQDLTIALLARGKRIAYEPDAKAYTEVPDTVRGLLWQRFRWTFGTIQCFWKYRHLLFSTRNRVLGFVVLPNIAIYGVIMPLVAPFIDLFVLMSLITGTKTHLVASFVNFTMLDMAYAFLALQSRGARSLVLLVPLQRIWYRQLLNVAVIKSLIRAIEGTDTSWHRVERSGYAAQYLQTALKETVPVPVPALAYAHTSHPPQVLNGRYAHV